MAAAMSDFDRVANNANNTAELMARVAYLEAEARQQDEDHMTHVMELSGQIREFVQRLDVSEAEASRLRSQLTERERQLEQRKAFENEALQRTSESSGEDLSGRLILLEARSAEQDLERRSCEEEHAGREAELTGHMNDLAKRLVHAEAALEAERADHTKLRKQIESQQASHIHLQVERESLVKCLKEQLDANAQDNFRIRADLERCMAQLRHMTSERPFLWDRRLVTQGLQVYFAQRDPAIRAEALARMADTLEFTEEERQRLGVVRKLARWEQELEDVAQANRRRRAFSELSHQFISFVSAEAEPRPAAVLETEVEKLSEPEVFAEGASTASPATIATASALSHGRTALDLGSPLCLESEKCAQQAAGIVELPPAFASQDCAQQAVAVVELPSTFSQSCAPQRAPDIVELPSAFASQDGAHQAEPAVAEIPSKSGEGLDAYLARVELPVKDEVIKNLIP